MTNPAAGFSLAFNQYGTVAATPYVPADQRIEGPEGLTFRTPVLEQPLDLAGPLALHLVAASTATDTDWHAKVADVAPDGSESIITEGSLRASHRALDAAQEHARPPLPPARRSAADRAEPLLRLRRRDLADGLPARRRAPPAAAADLDRPADAPAGIDRIPPRPAAGRADRPALARGQHRALQGQPPDRAGRRRGRRRRAARCRAAPPPARQRVAQLAARRRAARGVKLTGRAVGFRCEPRPAPGRARSSGWTCRSRARTGAAAASSTAAGRPGARRSCSRPRYLRAAPGPPARGQGAVDVPGPRAHRPGVYVARVRARDAEGRLSPARGRHVVQRFRDPLSASRAPGTRRRSARPPRR